MIQGNSRGAIGAYAANVAGWVWNGGNALQLVLGALILSPRDILSSVLNFSSSTAAGLFGHKNWGSAACALLGLTGTALALYPALLDGDTATWFGFVVFTFFCASNLFSPMLTKRFAAHANPWLRHTLGAPRRLGGLTSVFLSRLPIIVSSAMEGRTNILWPYVLWALGDLAFSFSKPEMSKNTSQGQIRP